MTKDEFAALEQEVNNKAIEYAQYGNSVRLREQIWLSLWEMRHVLFRAKAIRGYMNFPPSSLYETGEEFLTETFLESIPQVLDSYAKEYADGSEPSPFMKHFNICFFRRVYDAYSNIQDNTLHDYIVVRKSTVQVYQQPRKDAVIPDTFLKQGMVRRTLGAEEEWIKTKLKRHGRTIYVRKADVEFCNKATLVDMDSIVEPEVPGNPDDGIMLSDIYEDYILTLLSLVEQFYSRTQAKNNTGLSRQYCFRLLYTETLLDKLKRIYDAVGNVQTAREQEALSVAEVELLDYLLTDACRTFTSIAVTPLHAQRDFKYLNTDSAKEISLPAASIIYAHFLVDIKGINRKLSSIPPSISKYRADFKEQYDFICNVDAICR